MNFDDKSKVIVEQFQSMSTRQQQTILKQLEYLLDKDEDYTSEDSRFYSTIIKAIQSETGTVIKMSYSAYVKNNKATTLSSRLKRVEEFIEENSKGKPNRIIKQKSIRKVVKLIVAHQNKFGGIISVQSVLNKIDVLESLLDYWYPGLVRSGKGYMILK